MKEGPDSSNSQGNMTAADLAVCKKKIKVISSQCKICKATRPIDDFPGLPCCCTSDINEEVCCSCLVAALTKPTDNKCPRCREFVTLASSQVNDKPPWDVLSVKITMGVIDECCSCGEKKRLKPPNKICRDCQKEKEKDPTGLKYECQVCHQIQNIPYPLYKTQPSPRQYGNSKWWACKSEICGGYHRRWRIVDSDIDKLNAGDAPHSWAQYFIRRKLNKLPPNPAVYKTEAKILADCRFQVESVGEGGKSFLVATSKFPISIGPEDDNADWAAAKTTIRVRNERTNRLEIILANRLSSGVVQGRYTVSDDDFEAGDWLEAVDYLLLASSGGSRREFSIEKASTLIPDEKSPEAVQETPELGWQLQPYNIRIGKIGIVGHEFQDVLFMISVEKPVSTLWTDAVVARIEFSMDGENFAELLAGNKDAPSLRDLPCGPFSGSLYLKFLSINLDTLGGLVSDELGGGIHIAVLGPSDDGDTKVEAEIVVKPLELEDSRPDSPTVADLQDKILDMPLSEKRKRFLTMIETESQRDMFETNVDEEDVDLVLEKMVKNEDFVRRFLRDSNSMDGFGWVSEDDDEDLDSDSPKKASSSRSELSNSHRWTVVYSPDDNRVIVDGGEESQVFTHRPSSMSDLQPTGTEDSEAPSRSSVQNLGTQFEHEHPKGPASTSRSPHGTNVQMDGIHTTSVQQLKQGSGEYLSSDIADSKMTHDA